MERKRERKHKERDTPLQNVKILKRRNLRHCKKSAKNNCSSSLQDAGVCDHLWNLSTLVRLWNLKENLFC